MAFRASSEFSIRDSQITNVRGSQHIYVHGNLIQCTDQEELTVWNDYRRIRTGDVCLTQEIGNHDAYKRTERTWTQNLVAQRIFSVARVFGNKGGEFLHVGYTGQDALKAFIEDTNDFSTVKNVNIAQLFGYNNRHTLPAMVFYDALVPLVRIVDKLTVGSPSPTYRPALSRLFRIYCAVQMTIAHLRDDGRLPLIELGNVWVESRTGAFRKGPDFQPLHANVELPKVEPNQIPPLSLQSCSDINTIANHLIEVFSTEALFDSIGQALHDCTARNVSVDLDFTSLTDSCRNIVYKDNGVDRAVAFAEMPSYVHVEGACQYRGRSGSDTSLWTPGTVMKNGSFRFKFSELPVIDQFTLGAHITCRLDIRRRWFAQAHHIFGRLQDHQYKEKYYNVPNALELRLDPTEEIYHKGDTGNTTSDNPTVYLFMRSIPCLSGGEAAWKAWTESNKYYWSFDPTGRKKMSEDARISLGLPSFEPYIILERCAWVREVYDDIERIHVVKGFDSRSTALAESLGYTVIQLDDEQQLQVAKELVSPAANTSDCYSAKDVINPSEPGDDDVVVYPRFHQ